MFSIHRRDVLNDYLLHILTLKKINGMKIKPIRKNLGKRLNLKSQRKKINIFNIQNKLLFHELCFHNSRKPLKKYSLNFGLIFKKQECYFCW